MAVFRVTVSGFPADDRSTWRSVELDDAGDGAEILIAVDLPSLQHALHFDPPRLEHSGARLRIWWPVRASQDVEPPRADGPPCPLTRREQQVAALITQGRTNRQIASALAISAGTAANHVEHIREKLGVQSRSQVAAWAAQRGL